MDLFNNVIYNFGSDGAYAGEGGSYNFINNYYKPGPHTATKSSYKRLFTAYSDDGKHQNVKGTHGVFFFPEIIWILLVKTERETTSGDDVG